MNLKSISSGLLLSLCLVGFTAANASSDHAEADIRYVESAQYDVHAATQRAIQDGLQWNAFAQNNPTWKAEFDERTGTPRRSFGSPIDVDVSNDPVQVAEVFLQHQLSQYTKDIDLRFNNVSETDKYYYIDFQQYHEGAPVLFSRATVRLNKQFEVVMYGLEIHPDIDATTKGMNDQVSAIAAIDQAFKNPVADVDFVREVAVLPVPVDGRYEYKIVRAATVATEEVHWFGSYTVFIDAKSNEILYRSSNLHNVEHQFEVSGDVTYTNPHEEEGPANLQYLRLELDNGNTYYSDVNGEFTIDETLPVSGTLHLDGKWSYIQDTEQGRRISERVTITSNTDVIGFSSEVGLEEVSAYYHVNIVHDYMKQYLEDFSGLDEPLQTNVNLSSGSCNAYYDGESINFFTQSGGCYSFARIRDVVYHEYGHGVNGRFYLENGSFFQNGAMNEGYADVWGMGITEDPVLGPGTRISNPNSFVRRYDGSGKRYPDNLIGQVHNDGEIIAGAWWRTGQALGDPQAMIEIFSESMYGLATGPNGSEGQVYRDILLDAILADDDDGDLSNGTPNATAILESFAHHGIFLEESSYVHQPVEGEEADVAINLTIESEIGEFSELSNFETGAVVYYRPLGVNGWNSTQGVRSGQQGQFAFTIPAQPAGMILEYIINVVDSDDDVIQTLPETYGEGGSPYRLLIGFEDVLVDNLTESSTQWTMADPLDDAETGQWIIAEPVPTTNRGVTVQPGTDHSADDSNICAVTGNAGVNEQFGANDVDNGSTTLYSPVFDISDLKRPVVTYWRWFSNAQGDNPGMDVWRVEISEDQTSWITIEETATEELAWKQVIVDVQKHLPDAQSVQLRFIADDNPNNGGSIVEAAVDDVVLKDAPDFVSSTKDAADVGVAVYPMPAQHTVSVTGIPVSASMLTIVDAVGSQVYSTALSQETNKSISVANLPAGHYRLLIELDSESIQMPIVIVR